MRARRWLGQLVGGACVASALALVAGTASAAAPGDDSASCRSDESILTVDGRGEVTVRPDSVRVRVAVESQAKEPGEAQRQTSEAARKMIAAIEALEVPGLSLRTESLDLSPIYEQRPRPAEPPEVVAYRARNAVVATIKGAQPDALGDLAGRVLEAAQGAGATEIGGIELFVDDQGAARAQALEAAIADATRKAQAIAGAAGLALVRLQSVEATGSPGPIPMAVRSAESAAAAGAAAPPVEAGEQTVQANITVRFVFATGQGKPKPD